MVSGLAGINWAAYRLPTLRFYSAGLVSAECECPRKVDVARRRPEPTDPSNPPPSVLGRPGVPDEARKALETLLSGPLRFTPVELPEGERYRVEGHRMERPRAARGRHGPRICSLER